MWDHSDTHIETLKMNSPPAKRRKKKKEEEKQKSSGRGKKKIEIDSAYIPKILGSRRNIGKDMTFLLKKLQVKKHLFVFKEMDRKPTFVKLLGLQGITQSNLSLSDPT